jgi:sugar (pentulose or hexulose) kinase
MDYYAALDVSLRSVHLCVIDDQGELTAETKLSSEVTDIIAYLGGWHPRPIPHLWSAIGRL